MANKFGEPWSQIACKIYDSDGQEFVSWNDNLMDRICSCVNACAGIPTEELTAKPDQDQISAAVAEVEQAVKERDLLREVVIGLAERSDDDQYSDVVHRLQPPDGHHWHLNVKEVPGHGWTVSVEAVPNEEGGEG